jgi:hypothetical protein
MSRTSKYNFSENLADICERIFKGFPYNLLHKLPHGSQGGDGLLVFNRS